ncbi:uncharacterized protein LOC116932704 [Daphnia magna]|uniref:uncharacterized protein LOC116932704 n=1 Tax=Daphnia magna TaxID=35525 RepID=UPI001E1BA87C|nr:uncharacterized protein LOC116932704 [Daphnia magna]
MEGKPWGGFLDETSNFTSPYLLSFDEIEKLSKAFVPCSSNKHFKAESVMTTQMMPISYFEADPITLHNIQLVQYSKQMQEILQQIQKSYKKFNVEHIPTVPSKPVREHIQQHPSMKLTRRGVQQILHRSMYQVCAHEGFDSTTESVLSVLAGVTEEMLVKFCNLLKLNTEREILGQSTGFVDAMERTLHDVGMNGVKDLHHFYTNRVIRYNDRLRQQSHNLHSMCVKAAVQFDHSKVGPGTPWEESEWAELTEWSGNEAMDNDSSFNRDMGIKSQSSLRSNHEAINQLHLEDNTAISAPGLESGLRMLYTLEQQEAIGASDVQHLNKEDHTSPTFFTGPESTSPGAKQNGSKKQKKF